MTLQVLPFKPVYEAACAALLSTVWPEMFPGRKGAAEADFSKLTEGEAVFVALADEDVAGFVSVWLPDAFIHFLVVDQRLRGRGIGQTLLAHATDGLNGRADLKCGLHNLAARQFYLKRGWREIERVDDPHEPYVRFRLEPPH